MADTTIAPAKDKSVDELDSEGQQSATHAEHPTIPTTAAEREPYGPPGLRGLLKNPFVLMCAACSTLGGLIFGYDQGVVSVILVMDQFLAEFPRVAAGSGGAGFWKGLLTAMIELGALIGALNQGWIADKISRRYSILVAVAIFTFGSILQTAAINYPMLTVARLIGGLGIGMLSMVAPLYISEISKWIFIYIYLFFSRISLISGPIQALPNAVELFSF
jgi:MFS family permease